MRHPYIVAAIAAALVPTFCGALFPNTSKNEVARFLIQKISAEIESKSKTIKKIISHRIINPLKQKSYGVFLFSKEEMELIKNNLDKWFEIPLIAIPFHIDRISYVGISAFEEQPNMEHRSTYKILQNTIANLSFIETNALLHTKILIPGRDLLDIQQAYLKEVKSFAHRLNIFKFPFLRHKLKPLKGTGGLLQIVTSQKV